MRVDVAICTWNRSTLLAKALDHLNALFVPRDVDWQVLVVDNGSTDDTTTVLRQYALRLPLRPVIERTPGLSHARNRALAETTGDLLLFTDDDVRVDSHWMEALVDAFERHPRAAVAGGIIEPLFSAAPPSDLLDAFPELLRGFCGLDHGPDARTLHDGEYVFGANMAFRRAALGGIQFKTSLGMCRNVPGQGEEVDFIGRIRAHGWQVWWCPAARVEHYVGAERATRQYCAKHVQGIARSSILMGRRFPGVPVFGAPRWLWREMAAAWVKYMLGRVTPLPVPAPTRSRSRHLARGAYSRRVATLLWLREARYLRGMIEGHRAFRGDTTVG
jgi:glycosyltransferase involved in cell wall biosynthesis